MAGAEGGLLMNVKVENIPAWQRKVQKNVSRALDEQAISDGMRSGVDVAIQNDFFAALNMSEFKISAVGGRSLSSDE